MDCIDGKECDYCGGASNDAPRATRLLGSGPVTAYPAGDFHADCLTEMTSGDSDGSGEVS